MCSQLLSISSLFVFQELFFAHYALAVTISISFYEGFVVGDWNGLLQVSILSLSKYWRRPLLSDRLTPSGGFLILKMIKERFRLYIFSFTTSVWILILMSFPITPPCPSFKHHMRSCFVLNINNIPNKPSFPYCMFTFADITWVLY